MEFETITMAKESGVATLTLNRPDRLNALNPVMIDEIDRAIQDVQADDEMRAMIITGAGKGFCSGADVGQMLGGKKPEDRKSRNKLIEVNGLAMLNFEKLEKPLIAAVNGMAAGAGLRIALTCDIRIASETARFCSVWVRRGLIPDSGSTYWIPLAVGLSKGMELMLTGDVIDAREAERIRLVSKVVPAADLMKSARDLAARIASNPPISVQLIKRAVYRDIFADLRRTVDFETYGLDVCRRTEDHKEGISSFMEKRPPVFRGF